MELPDVLVKVQGPKSCKVGDTVAFKIILENRSGEVLNRLKAHIKAPKYFEVAKLADKIDELEVGGRAELEFQIKAVNAGEYTFKPADISYRIGEREYKVGSNTLKMSIIDIEESEREGGERAKEPEIKVRFLKIGKIKVGEESSLKASVENTGEVDVKSLRVLENSPKEVEVADISPKELGVLERGKSVEVDVIILASQSGEFETPLIELFYHDMQGRRYFTEPEGIKLIVE
ncbi:MAG TPA: hypothetical protein ENN13_01615 [Candidatus Altiarchaeales archaeon]|nr:hypothetical protein [Candidatus Altiarchaeales archaeon]